MKTRAELAAAFGIDWFDYQLEAFDGEQHTDSAELRACLYFRTGAGKTYTALAMLALAGIDETLVIAPPKTHEQWRQHAAVIGMTVRCISHAKYRMKGTKFSRLLPVIVDEFHMLGGSDGTGWGKLRVQARHMLAPLIILSATPNYNDVERVYCVEHVLNPKLTKGGFLDWIYQNCETEQNPFGIMPKVIGYRDGRPAKEHLAELPHVYYVEDPHEDFPIVDIVLDTELPNEFVEYGLDRRTRRIMASRMEAVSVSRKLQLIDDDMHLRAQVYDVLEQLVGNATTPVMVFCARATVATAAYNAAAEQGAKAGLVIFQQSQRYSAAVLEQFKRGELDVLFGTATMSTGVDGLDKVCDTLVLLDDTDDDSLRRQVIGRILPRGASSDVSTKAVYRLRLGA